MSVAGIEVLKMQIHGEEPYLAPLFLFVRFLSSIGLFDY